MKPCEIKTPSSGRPRRILLLQGPAGPFFAELQAGLIADGHSVLRVVFDTGDRLHTGTPALAYTGDLDGLGPFISQLLATEAIDTVVLFGDERPVHVVARGEARRQGIEVLCLEEGYFRPGYITAEWGGNNHNSPLHAAAGRFLIGMTDALPQRAPIPSSLLPAIRAAFGYYAARGLSCNRAERAIYHRRTDPLRDPLRWIGLYASKQVHRRADRRLRHRLDGELAGRYDIVALQIPHDASLIRGGAGWTTERMLEATIASFAAAAPADRHLVVKLHPLMLDPGTECRRIRALATRHGVGSRVHVARSGPLVPYLASARGFVTITSTAALTALGYDKVTLVLGRSITRSNGMTLVRPTGPEADALARLEFPALFWTSTDRAPTDRVADFLAWVRIRSQLPGDFYHARGREDAVRACRTKLARG